jgi:hypothetical protein
MCGTLRETRESGRQLGLHIERHQKSSGVVYKKHNKINEVTLKAPLPIFEGVGPSCQWLPAGPWKTVIDFFKEQYPHVDAKTWKARMAKSQVMDKTGRPPLFLSTAFIGVHPRG